MNKKFEWTGRFDPEDGEAAKRWHQIVSNNIKSTNAQAALIGFCCDEGVLRNKGRIGASKAPEAIRAALANLAWHGDESPIIDFGDVTISKSEKDNLEQAQDNLGDLVSQALQSTSKALVIGGGHETAAGSFDGLHKYLSSQPEKNIGIINLDAHFDLRKPGKLGISSGTPFYQIHQSLKERGQKMNYLCLGIAETSNTRALFRRAEELDVQYMLDQDMRTHMIDNIYAKIDAFLGKCDILYLSVDLDVLPHWQMPAVSAPASYGVELEVVENIIEHLKRAQKEGKIKWSLSDIVEFNPNYDQDDCAAKVAARLCDKIIRSMI